MTKKNIWVVDDERSIRWVLDKALSQNGWDVECFESAELLLNRIKLYTPEVVITDIRMPGMSGLELLRTLKDHHPSLPVIVMTAHSDLDSAVTSIQGGAFEYLPKPFEVDEAVAVVSRALARSTQTAKSSRPKEVEQVEIIGKAPAMQEVFRAIGRLSKSNVSVLINGQSGTGKERVAHALHKHSTRASSPFIPLNMAAIPSDLIESELFGHEKGAFTGAVEQRIGRFEQANGGTLFLDEIGDMPLETQTRLLRVLSNKEFFRVGGDKPIKVDVRILAATHQSLESLVAAGTFREDLYYRLNVIRVDVPPLRQRKEDVGDLSSAFLKRHADSLLDEPKVLSPEALLALTQYDWPGNVRQLENTCYWIALMAPTQNVELEDLPGEIISNNESTLTQGDDWKSGFSQWLGEVYQSNSENMLEIIEPTLDKVMIDFALEKTGGKKQEAAKVLGLGRNTLTKKIKAQQT